MVATFPQATSRYIYLSTHEIHALLQLSSLTLASTALQMMLLQC